MPSFGVTGETLRDVSGNGNHGTLTNMDAASDWVATSKGLALDFDGNIHRISIDSSFFNQKIVDSLSLVCFARCTNMNRYQVIGGGQDTTSIRYTASFNAGAYTGRFGFDLETVSTGQARLASEVYASNEWHHLVGTYDGSSTKLYVDGKLEDSSSSYSGNVQNFNEVRFGDDIVFSGRAFGGNLCNFVIYNRAISTQEIKQLYVDSLAPFRTKKRTVVRVPAAIPAATKVGSIKKPKTISKPSYQAGYARNASESENPNLWDGLVGAWMPSLGVTGETLRDVSGNGNHGTFEGGTSWGTNHQERSVYFDGNDDWVSGLGDVSLSASQPFSVTAKVKLIDYADYYPTIFQIKTDTNYSVSMFLSIVNGYQGLNFGSAQSWYRIRTGSSIAANETNFFVITYSGKGAGISSNFSIFQNGVRKSFVASSAFNTTSQDNYIGTTNNSSRVFDDFYGHINSASIYHRVLSPQEIKQLYVDSLAPFRKKQRVSVAVPAAVPTPSATYHPLRSLAHPLEQ
jgi:hypothetical protein